MAKLSLEDVKAKLEELGVDFDANADYSTLTALLKDAEAKAGEDNIDDLEEDTNDETGEDDADEDETEDDEDNSEDEDDQDDADEDDEPEAPKNVREELVSKAEARADEIEAKAKEEEKKNKARVKAKAELEKAKEKGKAIEVVVESSFFDDKGDIFRAGKVYDVTKSFFDKYNEYFVKEDENKVKLSDEPA